MITELSGGVVEGRPIDLYPRKAANQTVRFDAKEAPHFLGGEWSASDFERNLKRLGFGKKGKNLWTVPSYRGDLQEGVDLVEEGARLKGYQFIPLTLPTQFSTPSSADRLPARNRQRTRQVRRKLASLGFFETIHVSFLAPGDLAYDPELQGQLVSLANPLGADASILRPSLLPSLLKRAAFHHQHKIHELRLFELRKIFRQVAGKVVESLSLALTTTGGKIQNLHQKGEVDFFELKGVLDGLAGDHRLQLAYEKTEKSWLFPGKAARIQCGGEEIGLIGEIHPAVGEKFELQRKAIIAELDWGKLLRAIPGEARFREFSRIPQVQRDLAMLVDEAVPAGVIQGFLAKESPLVREVRIFDLYQGDQVPKGKKSLAFSLWLGDDQRTLTENEINEAWRRILESVRREFHAELR